MGTRLTPIAFDIETTGFRADAVVTTVGFALPLGCRVFLNSGDQPVETAELESQLAATFDTAIELSTHPSERGLLEAVTDYAEASLTPKDYLLVAYNGERYRSGFDLPFLRTRYALLGVAWPFVDLPYADVMPIFQNRFNTTTDDESGDDLEHTYETLVDGEVTDLDPFDDSGEAVAAFEDGEFETLLQHNVADVLRTAALAEVAEQYCGKSDFRLKSLTPTVQDSSLS